MRGRGGEASWPVRRGGTGAALRGHGRDVVGGLVGHGSAPVVVDDLDVVPVRVEHERAVVAGW